MGELTSTEDDANLNFVAIIEEFPGVAGLGFKVVLADLRRNLNLFQFGCVLVLAGEPFLLLRLEAEFSVVEDLADGRIGIGCDAIEVEAVAHREVIGCA